MGINKIISDEIKLSKSTVSRALNNCKGIDFATKKEVLELAKKYGYKRFSSNDVSVVMPYKPTFFWNDFLKKICKELDDFNINYSVKLYSSLYCEEDAVNCLLEAINSKCCVLIAILPDNTQIKEILKENSDRMLIILLEEYLDVVNTFYVGIDNYREGYESGENYIIKYPERKKFVIFDILSRSTTDLRIKGFKDAVNHNKCEIINRITLQKSESLILPYLIARELSKICEDIDCIFTPDGLVDYIESALIKLKLNKEIHCIGFDKKNDGKNYNNFINYVVNQDIERQSKMCAKFVYDYLSDGMYPPSKLNF